MFRPIPASCAAPFAAVLLTAALLASGCTSSGAAQSSDPPEAAPAPPSVSDQEKRAFRHPFVIPDSGRGDRGMLVVPPHDVHPEMYLYRWHPWENDPGRGFFLRPDWPEMLPDTLRGMFPERWRQRTPKDGHDEYGVRLFEKTAERLRRSAERMREQAARLERREKHWQAQIEHLDRQAERLRESARRIDDAAERMEAHKPEK